MRDETTPAEVPGTRGGGRRRPAVAAAGAAIVAVAVIAGVAALARQGGDTEGSSCVADLGRYLPADATFARGADLERARAAGYDDATTDGLVDGALDPGIVPDPHTMARVRASDVDDPPYAAADVACWVGGIDSFVARGSFDADRVAAAGGDAGLAVDGDLLTDAPGGRATAGEAPPPAGDALAALADEGVASFSLVAGLDGSGGGEDEAGRSLWAGTALAGGDGDAWDLVVVWAWPDDASADEGEDAVRAALADGSTIPDMVAGDPAEALDRRGTVLVLRAPLEVQASAWPRPVTVFDDALVLTGAD